MSTSPVFDPPIVAYTERDSIDPITCEEGKLRREWAIVANVTYSLPRELLSARTLFRTAVWDEYILIARYIRRGTVEPWQIFDFHPSEDAALRGILDSGVVPVDPRLVTIHREREWAQRVEEAKQAAESEKVREREDRRCRAAQGAKAFRKLSESGKPIDVELCERWNAFTRDPENVARRGELAKDEEFMERYNAAFYADRVPGKRKRMREFLEFVEVKYGWKAENVKSDETSTESEIGG